MQASNSGKQHYLRAVFSKAGSYALAVTVIDPVTSQAVHIPAHSASQQLIILPGPLAAERTQISDLPSILTAGVFACQHSGLALLHRCLCLSGLRSILVTICFASMHTRVCVRPACYAIDNVACAMCYLVSLGSLSHFLSAGMTAGTAASDDIIVSPYDRYGVLGAYSP